jgi:DNA-binding GntR family transcriptional regulator
MPATLKTRTLSAAITDRLRQDILAGVHPSGAPLKQDMLAASFGVSRIPVREALFQLEAEGLVRIEPHKGALVTGLSLAEVEDVFALRIMLEPRLLADSLPRLTDEDHARLDAIQSAFAVAIRGRDSARWGALNAELHLAMYARATRPRTLSIVTGLLQTSERYTRIQLATRQAWQRAQAEHGELIALCHQGNAEAACALLVRHVEAVRDDLVRLIDKHPLPASEGA